MSPEPTTENQNAIAERIDRKAAVIAEARGRWNANEIRDEMVIATPYEWTEADHEFFDRYLEWRSLQAL
jgi:hypothetical protein